MTLKEKKWENCTSYVWETKRMVDLAADEDNAKSVIDLDDEVRRDV